MMTVIAMVCAFLLTGTSGNGGVASAIQMKPAAIALDAPPAAEVRRSCVLRCREGQMKIASATASDPAIGVEVSENPATKVFTVTATIPAGYQTSRERPVEILLKTDLASDPVIRIPVFVWNIPARHDSAWLAAARAMIGSPLPKLVLEKHGGGKLDIAPVDGKVTVVVFSAHYCGHCDVHVPILETVWKDYAQHGVQFLGVAAGVGNEQGVAQAFDRWKADWPAGMDWGLRAVRQFGVKAFPVVFVVGYDGTIEAVHGRYSNNMVGNGLDNLETELRQQLDILLKGGTRADFPKCEPQANSLAASRPASAVLLRPTATRPAMAALAK